MAIITLERIRWQPIPDNPQSVTISIKRQQDPDEDRYYRIVESGVIVAADGIFSPVYEIDGLDGHVSYTVKIVTLCGALTVKKDFITPVDWAAYSYGYSLGFYS